MPPPAAGCFDSFRGLFVTPPTSNSPSHRAPSTNGSTSNGTTSGLRAPLAIVDMGSNGIRFGIISSLDRHLPVLYEERAPISLFDAQFSSGEGESDDLDIVTFAASGASAVSRGAGVTGGKKSNGGAPQLNRLSSSHTAVTPSISNSATIAAMGQGDGEEEEEEEPRAEDDLEDLIDDGSGAATNKADLRKTLVASDDYEVDHDITISPTNLKSLKGLKTQSSPSDRRPISEKVMDEVVRTFERWQALCQQANVETVRVIATEATRTAPNSEEFQARIKAATGWSVQLLSKADEADIGALGVMASYHTVQGLFMDLGGGSVQLNYIIRGPGDGKGESSKNAQSWPYGAAALSKRLNACGSDHGRRQEIYDEMVKAFKQGLEAIHVAPAVREHNEREGGYRLYLSGGGFRALGYLLMARKMKKAKDDARYPIPIINGYMASGKELSKIVHKYRSLSPEEVHTCFRVSKRRAKLVPACATLMAAVMEVIPIKDVLFSEGGVRQGGCFEMLPPHIQNKDPAYETVQSFVRAFGGGQPALHTSDLQTLTSFVSSALPPDFANCCLLPPLGNNGDGAAAAQDSHADFSDKDAEGLPVFIESLPRLIPLLVLVMNCYNQLPKEARSTAAWQLFLPGGALANCYGLTHSDRAILATVLSERHEGDLADPESGEAIKKLMPGGKIARQAAKYLGKILALAGLCSPLPGLATLLLGSGGPTKHGSGRISFEHTSPSIEHGDNSTRRSGRRDPDRTRVGNEDRSSIGSIDDTRDRDLDQEVVILQEGRSSEGRAVHGQVAVRVDKGHPLLEAPHIHEAVKELAEAAAKTHGFVGSHYSFDDHEDDHLNKGKSVQYS
ncbi:MAG: Ppx/GppA phosphatase family-domain-containing protein [Linnemannia gamsii]|nr:MAG: Ppx/GppA phosphatase family-domain-containing protein [Linnemannia gamsii]